MTIQSYHHANRLFRHSLGRIACSIHHSDATTLALVHVDMVETRKRYREHLEVRTRIQKVLAQRHVALYHNIRPRSTLNVHFRLAVRIYHNLMPLFLQILTSLINGFNRQS